MNHSTILKLAGYSALTATAILNHEVDAQIIYTDVDPDLILFNYLDDSYNLDFNGDGNNDMDISVNGWWDIYCGSSTYGPDCYGYSEGSVLAHANGFLNNAFEPYLYGVDTLNFGDPISMDGNFNPGFARLFQADQFWYDDPYLYSYNGNWFDIYNKYAGIRFQIDGVIHYGWVELSVIPTYYLTNQNVIIHGYAYEATPGMPIHAGDIGGCYPPEPAGTILITSTSGRAKWETVGSAEQYKLQYRAAGALAWTAKIIDAPKTFRKITGLTCNTNYEWQVKALCADGSETDYSPIQTFTTAVCKLENENTIDEENISIWAYANQIHILIDEDILEPAQFILFDELGRNVFSNQITESENVFELNLPNGIYIATIYYGDKMYSKKIVMQN